MNIHVANLSFDLLDEDLREIFVPYGRVRSAKIIMDSSTHRSRGIGYVVMEDFAEGRRAIEELNGSASSGRQLRVNEFRPQPTVRFFEGERNYNNGKSYNQTIY